MKLQGCESVNNLYVGENGKYTSPDVVKEMQQAISKCNKSDIQDEFGIMVDESTDIATTKALMVYAHLIVDGIWKTCFLADVKVTECDAKTPHLSD